MTRMRTQVIIGVLVALAVVGMVFSPSGFARWVGARTAQKPPRADATPRGNGSCGDPATSGLERVAGVALRALHNPGGNIRGNNRSETSVTRCRV